MYTYESFVFGYFFSLMGKAAGKKKIVTERPARAYMSKAELAELKCVYCSEGFVIWLFFFACWRVLDV